MIRGRCLCEGVTYEYDGEIAELVVCHCHQCKRAQGTPFVANAPIDLARFKILAGESLLKSYFSSPNKRRVFCRNCGTPLFSQLTDKDNIIRLRVGTVTEGEIPEPRYQIHCDSKSPWCVFADDMPTYPAGMPAS